MTEQEKIGRQILELHKKHPGLSVAECADLVLNPFAYPSMNGNGKVEAFDKGRD